ncbi:MAG: cytochrome c biogenesis protein CcsA [Deltaproteobacteria bacterium]|nr:cytochrome c biogenesis protein CcsA [Deltaproteobacteria bacterium]
MSKTVINRLVYFVPWVFLLTVVVNLYLIFFFAPEESSQGPVQKIFYFHVASAFAMYLGFIVSGVAALVYVIKKTDLSNALAHAGASVGLVFCSMVLLSGPLWAKPVWGAYWTWDPRLTTTLILWLVFFATLLLRKFYGPDQRGRIFAAVFTLFGVLDIPLVVFAVKVWRGIHPVVLGQEGNMPCEMKATFAFTVFTIIALAVIFIFLKTHLLLLEESAHKLEGRISEGI